MSARKWFYKVYYALQKLTRKPLEVSIANASLDWMFERGKEVQAQLYQAEYRPYMEHPHCFKHGLPVPYRETSPGHLECPFWQQHGPQPPLMQPEAQLRPLCPNEECNRPMSLISRANWICFHCADLPELQRVQPPPRPALPSSGGPSVTTRTTGEFAREATGKPYHHTQDVRPVEWPTTDKVQAPAWDEMKRYGSGQ